MIWRERAERRRAIRAAPRTGEDGARSCVSRPLPDRGQRRRHDLVGPDQDRGGGGPSGTKLSTARTDQRRRPVPASARSARIASATPPPVRRHSSTTSTAPIAAACSRIASVGERVEPAEVEHARGDLVLLAEASRGLQREAQAVAVADDQEVGGARVERAVDADLAGEQRAGRRGVVGQPAAVAIGLAGPSRGRARSAPGRPPPGRPRPPWRPRRAASVPRRRRAPGPPRPGRGCRAARRRCCRCGSGRRSPSGRRARGRAPPSGCGTGRS